MVNIDCIVDFFCLCCLLFLYHWLPDKIIVCICIDIQQILQEAQHRWLRPAEICEILRNYRKFRIAPEPPNMPPSMILYPDC